MKLINVLKSLLVVSALCATFAGSALAAVAAPLGCRDAQCLGGGLHCADLPNGIKCYTLIIIEVPTNPTPVQPAPGGPIALE
jgi:hypothetical protein